MNEIYDRIMEAFKRHQIPVDKFGHFYSKGVLTVDKLVSPDFNDQDLVLALLLELGERGDEKRRGRPPKTECV